MKFNVIITGSTGMVGKGVLLECLEHPDVASILVINRRPLGMSHPKLKEVIHQDFFDLEAIRNNLSGYDACFFCLGVSAAGMSEEKYTHLTYDLTMGFARVLVQLNPGMTFCYVSGMGTDETEKGRQMWARVKGKTENDLLSLGFRQAFMFRPGFIQPYKGVRPASAWYGVIYPILKPFYPILKRIFPGAVTTSVNVGLAMIEVVKKGYSKRRLENPDINKLAGK